MHISEGFYEDNPLHQTFGQECECDHNTQNINGKSIIINGKDCSKLYVEYKIINNKLIKSMCYCGIPLNVSFKNKNDEEMETMWDVELFVNERIKCIEIRDC